VRRYQKVPGTAGSLALSAGGRIDWLTSLSNIACIDKLYFLQSSQITAMSDDVEKLNLVKSGAHNVLRSLAVRVRAAVCC